MGKIKETIEEGKAKGKKKLLKAAAVVVSAGLLTAGTLALIDNIPQQGNSQNSIQGPEPVVLEIDEEDMAATSESEEEEEEEKKRGFFGYLKAALYGMAAAIGTGAGRPQRQPDGAVGCKTPAISQMDLRRHKDVH